MPQAPAGHCNFWFRTVEVICGQSYWTRVAFNETGASPSSRAVDNARLLAYISLVTSMQVAQARIHEHATTRKLTINETVEGILQQPLLSSPHPLQVPEVQDDRELSAIILQVNVCSTIQIMQMPQKKTSVTRTHPCREAHTSWTPPPQAMVSTNKRTQI